MELKIGDPSVPCEVRESSQATRPRIDYRSGSFTVVIPERSRIQPQQIIEQNREWVNRKLEEAQDYREKVPERSFQEGEKFCILGEEKEIIVEKRRSSTVGDNIFLAEHLVEKTSLKDQLEKALRKEARETFEEKADRFSVEISEDYGKIFVRDQKTRWGSCSGKSNLNFNWRLVLGPEHVLEYVVVHELVHLEVRNHSESFWSRVEEMLPDYRESREWLKENSAKLVFDPSS